MGPEAGGSIFLKVTVPFLSAAETEEMGQSLMMGHEAGGSLFAMIALISLSAAESEETV